MKDIAITPLEVLKNQESVSKALADLGTKIAEDATYNKVYFGDTFDKCGFLMGTDADGICEKTNKSRRCRLSNCPYVTDAMKETKLNHNQ